MKNAVVKNFSKPDMIRTCPKARLELLRLGGATVGRTVFEPGWRWTTSVQPLLKTKSCETPHLQFHLSGVLRVRMDNGSEVDCLPGDVSSLPPGHDAWVVGDESVVVVELHGRIDGVETR